MIERKPIQKLPRRGGSTNWLTWIVWIAVVAALVWIWQKDIFGWRRGDSNTGPPVGMVLRTNAQNSNVTVRVATRAGQSPAGSVRVSVGPTNPVTPRLPVLDAAPGGKIPRAVQNIFEAQLVLARRGFSSGSIDGAAGSQTRAALAAFQRSERIEVTGVLDAETKARLLLSAPPVADYIVTTNDLARLRPLATTWLEKSRQSALDYETILELVAEKSWSHPGLLRRLNPSVTWTNVAAGDRLQVANVEMPKTRARAALIRIRLAEKVLEAFDASTNLLAHFPCSIAQRVEKRPVGELHVLVLAPNPTYVFDPDNFPESSEARELKRKLILPAGPNNPVGTAWIGLDRPGYGIHGTPQPEQVGRTESHGCFRLANWNAEYLIRLVAVGTTVIVEP